MNEPVRVVRGYGRASTDEQIISPDQQHDLVKEAFGLFCKSRPRWQSATWGGFFFDRAEHRDSKFREREVGSLVLAATQPNDVILVAKFDRIFANTIDVCETIELIEQRQFGIVVLDMDIPLDTNLGRATFTIIATIKKLEVAEIRDRVKRDKAYRRKVGLPNNQHSPIGWKVVAVEEGGRVRRYYAPDHLARRRAEALLALRAGEYQFVTMKAFVAAVNAKGLRRPSDGGCWDQWSLPRWLKAAEAGFPCSNGSHEAVPIPAGVTVLTA